MQISHLLILSSPLKIGESVEVNIDVTDCANITILEHVVANVSLNFHRRGDVKVILISPSHTSSEMLSYRDNDSTDKGKSQWTPRHFLHIPTCSL